MWGQISTHCFEEENQMFLWDFQICYLLSFLSVQNVSKAQEAALYFEWSIPGEEVATAEHHPRVEVVNIVILRVSTVSLSHPSLRARSHKGFLENSVSQVDEHICRALTGLAAFSAHPELSFSGKQEARQILGWKVISSTPSEMQTKDRGLH